MKICFLANCVSVHTQRWAKHFAHCGYDVTVISFERGRIEGVRLFQLPASSAPHRVRILLGMGQVHRLVNEINPDVVHAHYVTSYGLAGALTDRHPLVVTAWGSDVLVTPEESWVYRQIVRFALSRADLITSMAEHMTQRMIKRRYATAEKIITLPFGVDTNIFNPDCRSGRHGHGFPLVISTRRLDYGLDVHLFIQAIPRVVQSYPDAKFIVTSDGPLRCQLRQTALDLGIAECVEFRGEIPHQEMPKLLGEADVFVSTSRSDGNNISLNEAMACGAFPVATDIPANRQWIEAGKNGLLFPSQDADGLAQRIIQALQRPDWRQAVIAQNWQIVCQRASWRQQMAEMEKWYATLVR